MLRVRTIFFPLLLAACLLAGLDQPRVAQAAEPPGVKALDVVEGVHSYMLANGLKVLLVPEPSQPKVTVRVLYRVGSRHEGAGETGMAHLLEHMLFKGSPRHRDVLTELTQHGAESNAETDSDATVYYETLVSTPENLRFALDLEADRMTAARLEKSDLSKEFSVVRNELELSENSPSDILQQRLLHAAFIWHGYGRDTIGSRSDIEHVPIERLRLFYRQYYQPDNAVLIVAGSIDRDATLRLIASLFGRLPRPQRRLLPTYTVEQVQDGEREVTIRRVADVQLVGLLYHGVAAAHPDAAAAQAAADILTRPGSGRLYQALVEPRLATNLRGDAPLTEDPGIVTFMVDVPKTQPIEPIREKLQTIVEELGTRPVTISELRRFQSRARKEFVRSSSDPEAVAAELAHFASVGDWRLRYLYRDRVEQLTPEAVQSFARRYFLPSNRTVGLYLPTAQPRRSPPADTPDLAAQLKGYRGQPPPPAGEVFTASAENIESRVQRLTLPNGMKVALLPKRSRGETVHLVLHVNAGTPQSARGKGALLELLGPMLERGTRRHTFLKLSEELDRLNAELTTPALGGFALPSLGSRVEVETSRQHLQEVLALIAELVAEPIFPKEQLEIVRKELVTTLEATREEPTQLVGRALLRRLFPYPADDPRYVPTLPERMARLGQLRSEELRQFHSEYWGGGAAQLVLVGDFDPQQVLRALESHFGSWRAPRGYERLPYPYVPNAGGEELIRVADKHSAAVLAGQALELGDQDPDYPALSLFGYLLGGSENARLTVRLREQAGASYTVSAAVSAGTHDRSGYFVAFFTCAPQNAMPSVRILERELADLVERGPSAAELRLAQLAYRKAYEAELANDQALAGRLATHLESDRTLRFDQENLRRMSALTLPEFLAAVRRHIVPSRLIKVVAGDLPK